MQYDYHIQTDVSGSWGCAAFFEGKWFQLPWNESWISVGILVKELASIFLSVAVLGNQVS